jgi:2-(1,2-epoxy-1,2-dihydrophenyl)acetyl-CoA isomerase
MNHDLVKQLYAALEAGDRDAVVGLLHPRFEATFTESLPDGIGGTHRGQDAIDRGWWAIGRAFAIRAQPAEYIDCSDGRLLVLGRYRGHHRRSGRPIDAAFVHLWSEADGTLAGLHQITDSARWLAIP